MQTKTKRPLRVGLFGIGLDSYWPQFKGLKQRLEGYVRVVRDRLKRAGVEVVNLGLIDSPFKTLEAGHRFRQEDVDLIFLHVATYALSSTVLPVLTGIFVENTLHVGSAGTIPQTSAENNFVFSVGASKHERLNRRFIQSFWEIKIKSVKKGIHP